MFRVRAKSVMTLLVAVAVPAAGQSIPGSFQNMDPWITTPTLGVRFEPSDDTIRVDRDGDGVEDSSFARPTGLNGLTGSENLRLLPTREVLYAFGTSCGASGTK